MLAPRSALVQQNDPLHKKKLHIPVPVAFKAGEEVVELPIEKFNGPSFRQFRVFSYEKKSALRDIPDATMMEAVVEELMAFVYPKGFVCWADVLEERFDIAVALVFRAAKAKGFALELALDVVARVNVEEALDKLVALPPTAAAADRPDGSWLELLDEFEDGLRGLAPEGVDIDKLVDDEELELNEDWGEDGEDLLLELEVEDSEVGELVEDTLELLSSDEDSVLDVVLVEDDSARC